jgi:hypothetical protein
MALSAEPLSAPSRTQSATVPALGKNAIDELVANRASPVRSGWSLGHRAAEFPDDCFRPHLVAVVENPQFRIDLSDGDCTRSAGCIEVSDLGLDTFALQDRLEMANDGEVDVVENELHGWMKSPIDNLKIINQSVEKMTKARCSDGLLELSIHPRTH